MFPLPRVIYAMATDGLLFKFLANVNKRFQTPFIATFLSGIFAGTCIFFLFIIDKIYYILEKSFLKKFK
jgi:amino acid transporter